MVDAASESCVGFRRQAIFQGFVGAEPSTSQLQGGRGFVFPLFWVLSQSCVKDGLPLKK